MTLDRVDLRVARGLAEYVALLLAYACLFPLLAAAMDWWRRRRDGGAR